MVPGCFVYDVWGRTVVTKRAGDTAWACATWDGSNYGDAPSAALTAMWSELEGIVPADMLNNSIRNQLECHMAFAPKKDSWNLDDWHQDVQYVEVVLGRCNPGGEEH